MILSIAFRLQSRFRKAPSRMLLAEVISKMIMNNSIRAASAGAVGGGFVTGGLLGLSVALMDPAMPQGMVLIGSAVYGGAVCGGILGALVGIARKERERGDAPTVIPQASSERVA